MAFEVETRSLQGCVTAVGSAGGHTVVIDRPEAAGGGGLGFNGGELLHLAVAGCVSNDLFREALAAGIRLDSVRVRVRGDFAGEPAVSSGIRYDVEIAGDASEERLAELVARVDRIAEIPGTLRRGAAVQLGEANVRRSTRA
ncbi:OsmC family protein [Anaeromyxobacter sp. K]|uniref:OsmC family protein n=1 Tax=Anaeromyxobacter sp. (strain K) TaxID=447217 RepID=UPI00015F89BE|nr:OsmC family protein [Anaeromyxobacter sp. K]ACG72839.1 OsmC family protein [Anaeromyxobacter sp. K]